MDNRYSKQVMRHFLRPKNVGKIKNPSGKGRIGNSVCGDIMEMTIKVNRKLSFRGAKRREISRDLSPVARDDSSIIINAKFQTFGCGAAVATSSIVTELIKGKTVKEAKKLTPGKVDRSLGNLPIMKKHCARLAIDALKKAIDDYEKKS